MSSSPWISEEKPLAEDSGDGYGPSEGSHFATEAVAEPEEHLDPATLQAEEFRVMMEDMALLKRQLASGAHDHVDDYGAPEPVPHYMPPPTVPFEVNVVQENTGPSGSSSVSQQRLDHPQQPYQITSSDQTISSTPNMTVQSQALMKDNNGTRSDNNRSYSSYWLLIGVLFIALLCIAVVLVVLLMNKNSDDNSASTMQVFQDSYELRDAVDAYLQDPSASSDVAGKYGYPIGKWDVSQTTDFSNLFSARRNQNARTFNEALDMWDVSNAINMEAMFYGAEKFNGDISMWQVDNVSSMKGMFSGATAFNQDISYWDTGEVTDMSYMFEGATSFDGDLDAWDVSRVQYTSHMFNGATSFNGDISRWSLRRVEDMAFMFFGATSFSQDLCDWVDSVDPSATLNSMFEGSGCPNTEDPDLTAADPRSMCYSCLETSAPSSPPTLAPTPFEPIAFTSTPTLYNAVDEYLNDPTNSSEVAQVYGFPIGTWDVSQIDDFSLLFSVLRGDEVAMQNFNEDLSGWNVSNAMDMTGMFAGASSFDGDISAWDVSKVERMLGTFLNCSAFTGDVSLWDVSSVRTMQLMFSGASSFNSELSIWDTSNVNDMSGMFEFASSFNSDISSWDTSNVFDMGFMFDGAAAFNADISGWNVSRVFNMSWAFRRASEFNQDLSSWDVGNVKDMTCMFCAAEKFNGDVSLWDVSNVGTMNSMFLQAFAFQQNISSWDTSNVEDMRGMFFSASNFNGDLSEWNLSSVTEMQWMFYNASSFNENLCPWGLYLGNSSVNVTDMFNQSGCITQADPDLNAATPGPLCFEC